MTGKGTRQLLPGFLTVGSLGFLLDACVFQILYVTGYGAVASRVVSASLSITLTWFLNRHFVFRTASDNASATEYARYISVQALGLVVNFGIYFTLIASTSFFGKWPILALCSGAIAAITLNFCGARYFAFRRDNSHG